MYVRCFSWGSRLDHTNAMSSTSDIQEVQKITTASYPELFLGEDDVLIFNTSSARFQQILLDDWKVCDLIWFEDQDIYKDS